MKKFKIVEWEEANNKKASLLNLIDIVLQVGIRIENPRGKSRAKQFNRIAKALNEAFKTKELILEDKDYQFIARWMDKYVPANLGFNNDVFNAIIEFTELK